MSDTAAPAVSQEAKPKQAKKNHLSGGFFRFVLTRFLLIIPTVFILVTVVFFVMRATIIPTVFILVTVVFFVMRAT
ncbi:hypothetical protein KHP57_20825, partial [Algiphilus sp. NNCM1]|nr:hypothetical protein [Algiphilus acroporae]